MKQLPLIGFDALAHEAAAVNEIKRHKRFTVVIGNPPYAGKSSNRGEWIENLINDYRKVDGKPLGEVKVWLKDDYVKFTRLSERLLETTHVGILGFITNNSYFDGLTFRGMRHHLLSHASCGYFMNLHGNGNLKERAPDGSPDENVFDILQGVGISLLLKSNSGAISPSAFSADIYGTREAKYKRLASSRFSKADYVATNPKAPNYFVVRQNEQGRDEYEKFMRIPDLFEIGGLGFQSHRDNFIVAHSAEEITARMKEFFDLKLPDKQVKEKFAIDDYRRFVVGQYRRQNMFDRASVHRLQYRPFDYRHIYYARDIVQEWQIRFHGHLLKPNLGLNVMRQTKAPEWRHVMVSTTPTPAVFIEIKDGSSQFPLWRYAENEDSLFATQGGRVPNLNERIVYEWFSRLHLAAAWLSTKPKSSDTATPEDIFQYAYAVFHSPGYRSRYAEFLKIDFPRLPLTGNLALFRALARLGSELTALHLLESPRLDQPITEFIGNRNPEVEKVSWSGDTVWLDKAQTMGFRGVREDVWNFHIGGYQVCAKWLKDRKGRTLSDEDIAHYQKIVVALSETIRLMQEIDEVIDQHGGWPGAFATKGAATDRAAVDAVSPVRVDPLADDGEPVIEEEQPLAAEEPGELFHEPECSRRMAPAAETEPDGRERPELPDRGDLIALIRETFGDMAERDRDAAIEELARAVGFQRVSARVRDELDNAIRTAVRRQILWNAGSSLRLMCRSIGDYQRDFLKDQFLASLEGRVWKERDDAIRDFARWMGFRRTGAVIRDTARSLVTGLLREGRLESAGTMIRRT